MTPPHARPRLVLSELTKLLTLRPIWITASITVAVDVLAAWSQAGAVADAIRSGDPSLAPGTVPETVGFEWVALGLIGIIVIGVVAASSEYSSGQLSTTFVAVPNRLRLFCSKVVALAILVALVGVITVPLLSLLSQLGLGDLSVIDGALPASLLQRWAGAVVYWVAISLISFAIATLLRQALIPLLALIVISQLSLLQLLLSPAFAYLPTIAGVQLFDPGLVTGAYPDATLGLPVAAAVTVGWTLVLLVVAAHRFLRRDV